MNSSPSKVDAVILAGGPGFAPEGAATGTAVPRAMIPVAGKSMLQWEVDAMRRSQVISRICAVGDCRADGLDEVIPSTDTFVGNMLAGVTRARENGAESVLIATCDIPLITEDGVRDFIERAQGLNAEFCYPIISKEDCVAKYPEMRRTYLKLKEGTFSGGNMMLVSVDFVVRNRELISQAYEARKKVFRLAGMIGWGVLARVLIAQALKPSAIDLPRLESAVSRLLQGKVRAVITPFAEIGEDVDNPEDLAVVERALAARGDGAGVMVKQ
jgi:molybdopterin-guanine dinucleotide biosynthesis protein A